MLASFHSFTWTGFFMQVGMIFAPAVLAAAVGARGGAPGTRLNIALMAGMFGLVVTFLLLCLLPKKEELGVWSLLLPLAVGAAGSYLSARALAR